MSHKPLKPGEEWTDEPLGADAVLGFIGHVETPWKRLEDCPKRADPEGPESRVIVKAPWSRALEGVERFDWLELSLWLHRARRDLLRIAPSHADGPRGVFALRSPVRPNPIGVSVVKLVARQGDHLVVTGLEALDGTPLLDIKPGRCPYA